MKKPAEITCLCVDNGGVLLTNGWDHQGKLTFQEYLEVCARFRRFMCDQSKPYDQMLGMISATENEVRPENRGGQQ